MDALQAGDPVWVGPYELIARLGAGGMGQVYLGRDPHGGLAAVKVVHPGFATDPDFRGRFAREITTARRVDSPYTAAVLHADPQAAQPWLATQYVPGPDLDHVISATGPLPETAVAVLASRLAHALAHLHANGVVHRDLKPSNVLLAPDGPRLIDFGIARATDTTKITHTGVVVGTPAFMSPEQALGHGTGFPSDVFSLAAVVTFAATGAGPFGRSTGNPIAMLRRVSAAEPDLFGVPAAVQQAIAPCLVKDPSARPTAGQLAARLAPMDQGPAREWLPPEVGALVARSAAAPIAPPRRRGRRLAAVAVAVAAVALAAAGGFALSNATAGPVEPVPAVAAAPTSDAPVAPRTFPASPAPPPPPASQAALIASRIPGWFAAVSTTRNAAYDVPPTWTLSSPGLIRGFRTEDGSMVLMSGVAIYEGLGPSPCPDEEQYTLAWSGVSGAPTADAPAAARAVAELWTGNFALDDGTPAQVAYGVPQPVTVDGRAAYRVTADVTAPPGGCGSPRKAVHTVAVPDGKGESVVWVLLAERDVPGAVTDAEIEQIIPTLRPAGLQQKCDPSSEVVGSWC